MAQNGLASYEIQYNNKYKDLIKAINGDFIKTYKNDTAASSEKNISEEQNPLKIINL